MIIYRLNNKWGWYVELALVIRSTTSKNKVSIEFIGLILILIGVIGIGVFGPVGSLIKHFAIFLVGTYSNILILFNSAILFIFEIVFLYINIIFINIFLIYKNTCPFKYILKIFFYIFIISIFYISIFIPYKNKVIPF